LDSVSQELDQRDITAGGRSDATPFALKIENGLTEFGPPFQCEFLFRRQGIKSDF
jgi:hypothetical protein